MSDTYDNDFYTWAREQAALARARSSNELDWDHIAEELEGLSRSEYRELRARFIVLMAHLLKWAVQPQRRSRSWTATIREQRRAIVRHLNENPGLIAREGEAFHEAYASARDYAITQTDLEEKHFPTEAPFTLEQVRDADWLPEAFS
jgi:Domain of unknown function DUF29